MQDPDVPPQGEGDTNGVVDVVHQNAVPAVARWAAIARSSRASSPLPWITPTAPTWAATTGMAAGRLGDLVFPRPTRWSILNLCRLREKMLLRASLLLSKTSSS